MHHAFFHQNQKIFSILKSHLILVAQKLFQKQSVIKILLQCCKFFQLGHLLNQFYKILVAHFHYQTIHYADNRLHCREHQSPGESGFALLRQIFHLAQKSYFPFSFLILNMILSTHHCLMFHLCSETFQVYFPFYFPLLLFDLCHR